MKTNWPKEHLTLYIPTMPPISAHRGPPNAPPRAVPHAAQAICLNIPTRETGKLV